MAGARGMTEAFGVPLALDSKIRDGSLREAAGDADIPVILYEAGEALRFEELYIRAGVNGIVNVLRHLGVLRPSRRRQPLSPPIVSDQSSWLRAPESGILSALVPLGAKVVAGQTLAVVADPLGSRESPLEATHDGVVIGRSNLPLVYEGDAVFHIARYGRRTDLVERHLEEFQEHYGGQER